MNADLAYLLGMLHDGHISFRDNRVIVEFYQQNTGILQYLQQILERRYNYRPRITKHRGAYRLRVFKKEISSLIANLSRNTDFRKIPWSIAKYFVAGYIDAEGCLLIDREYTRIVVTQADKEDLLRLSELIEENTEINCTKIQGPYAHKMSKKRCIT